ncbi:hypothetical protein BLL38_21530 [Pseudomonas gessardii]|nr:hypothetical protein BLL38_21530 [Pseudomonas gessardii]
MDDKVDFPKNLRYRIKETFYAAVVSDVTRQHVLRKHTRDSAGGQNMTTFFIALYWEIAANNLCTCAHQSGGAGCSH